MCIMTTLAESIQKSDLKVPRYTSYPTAPHFHEGIGATHYAEWLAALPADEPISLYFHIPYCRKLCYFCGCHMSVVNDYSPVERYMELLLAEMDLVLARLSHRHKVGHVHFGGGSPTILSPSDFLRIMDKVHARFDVLPTAEIAVEIDPRTISPEKVAAYAAGGVNRSSMGVQDFDPKVQKEINREQPYEVVADALDMLRGAGIGGVNMDLIYGLPHQTLEKLIHSIDLSLQLNPDRIALFGYAHVPWMKKHQELMDVTALPDITARVEMADAAKHHFVEKGYAAIGLDHFARADDDIAKALKSGKLHRNFQGYTTDTADTMIGFGISSIGQTPEGYVQNIAVTRHYGKAVTEGQLPTARGVAVNAEDALRRDIINHLMCYLTVTPHEMAAQHGLAQTNFSDAFERLKPLEELGLVTVDTAAQSLTIPESGRIALRIVASVFDTYLKPEQRKHSIAV